MLCTTAINTSNTITRGRPGLVNTDCAAEITDGKKTGYSQKWTANRSENASARSSTYARIHRRTTRKHNAPGRICRMGAEIIPIQSNSSMHRYARSAVQRHQSPDRPILCQISSLMYPKIQRRQVIRNVLHPSCARPPRWSPPVLYRKSEEIIGRI